MEWLLSPGDQTRILDDLPDLRATFRDRGSEDEFRTAAMKLGRNDPCWCNSGKKYKKCHLDREKQPAVRPWEVDAQIRGWNRSGQCLHVGATAETICGRRAIGSHTVPKKMLTYIARAGHVYGHSASVQDLIKTGGSASVKAIGVNEASVLRVFCEAHDNDAFAPLEREEFTGTDKQCFMLAYRAVCHESFKKSKVLNSIPSMMGFDRGIPIQQQMGVQTTLEGLAVGSRLAMRDMDEHKQRFDIALAAGAYSEINAFIVTFDSIPDILCSGAMYPEYDFSGKLLQRLGEVSTRMKLMTFSLIATDAGGAFVFAWHKSSDAVCRPLAESLEGLPDEALPHAVVRFVFEFCENHYFRPQWWDNADTSVKSALARRFDFSASPREARSPTCLVDDGLRAVTWDVAGRTWV